MDPSGRSRRGPGATRGFSPAPRDAVSPLQLSVYWRLALAHFFTSFLFFLDVYAAAAVSCRHGNGTEEGGNRSRPAEDSDGGKRNLVCDWTDWLAYAQTLYMVGLLLGSLVGGAVSDRYGKRTVLLVCVYVHALCGLVPALLPRAFLYLAVRCVTGVCCCCINICSFSLAVEWTPPAARLWASAFLPFCFSLGMMGGAPLAWLSATWTRLHLTLAVPQLVCLPLYLWIPESPRWLLLRRRTDVLDRYRDNSPADKQCLDLLLWSDLQKDTEDQKDPPPGGHAPSDIIYLRHPTVLLRLFVMSFVSAASALTYFGICMNIGSFGVGVYSAQFFSGLSEAPCLLVPLVRLGRRPISMLALFLSGAACFLSLLLSRYDAQPVLVMSLALLGKLCILAALFISILYSIELFPTVVRQRCVSLVNLSFRIGCLVNSVVPATPTGAISLAAMVAYSSGPIAGCALCLLLPETSGVPLPDSVEDCDRQPMPRLPSAGALWRKWKLVRSQTRNTEPETPPAEKDDTHTHRTDKTHTQS
ncbi:solute carrier family 22 member 6 isoform X1 [Gasterosteus aculeatus]|uniref:Major facilitator superfamily (MFS) profile domain-containing protein n=1 Tax=Gasterosteus aculeatus aculeatus TaxID=481459 RepID=G3P8P7_GASAC|nr:solute carrier family 22 member 13 [Gasterosteus aculeatus aculeatus]